MKKHSVANIIQYLCYNYEWLYYFKISYTTQFTTKIYPQIPKFYTYRPNWPRQLSITYQMVL